MLTRRATALFLTLVLLAGFGAVPALPSFVCAMTGMPMPAAPVADAVADKDVAATVSCCHPAMDTQSESKKPQTTLGRASCCELTQAPDRDPQSATIYSFSAPVAPWTPAPNLPRALTLPASALRAPWASESVPRGPPLANTPSRAPPSFS